MSRAASGGAKEAPASGRGRRNRLPHRCKLTTSLGGSGGFARDFGSPGAGRQLFDQFYNNNLDDTNWVGIGQLNLNPNAQNNPCCEVSWGLIVGGIDVPPG
jgi:hypothetical protein